MRRGNDIADEMMIVVDVNLNKLLPIIYTCKCIRYYDYDYDTLVYNDIQAMPQIQSIFHLFSCILL
jgi:hypothetical protein